MNGSIYKHHIENIKLEQTPTRDAAWVHIELKGNSYCDLWLIEDQAAQLRDCLFQLYPSLKQPEPPAPESAEAVLEALADREATRAGNVYPF